MRGIHHHHHQGLYKIPFGCVYRFAGETGNPAESEYV